MKIVRAAILLGAMAAALPAVAQDKGFDKPVSAPATDAGTRQLNQEEAAAAQAQNAANAAGAVSYSQAVQDYEADRSRVAAQRSEYEVRMEAHRQAQADYDAAYARWQADVAACERGERERCAQPAPQPR